ncbi:hypothetical protein BABINDRAFT_8400 [Babjeviella inositovora NRRL Y-12698]|uniref:DNA repair and recombination protein RAD54 n=1 Tax=Babjeviella inositovora NRRL Y-12698 TaxID=984486 RepID=A0A1E3QP91_9ASCO|nr:uncharacterized protein BABINDRAFT_8400 [Babjeviella inositovora NRRL Y-12698]ODQ79470.1 hypothetical protein BABINDRAFT_8400 [Babjeviella inositovora NRRL Y-12698]
MAPKKLNGPVNELRAGIALPPHLRPKAVTNPLERLAKPFKVPVAPRHKLNHVSKLPARMARTRAPVSYVEDHQESDGDASVAFDVYGSQVVVTKRIGALLSRRLLGETGANAELKLMKSFAVPLSKDKRDEGGYKPPPPPLGTRRMPVLVPRALHDPTGEFAIVLYDPTVDVIPQLEEEKKEETPEEETEQAVKRHKTHKSLAEILGINTDPNDMSKHPNVPVVIDPKLAKILRPHQVAGVQFLYRCTAGLIDPRAKGCIMADEMGLGKTLQCIALLWTLIKQGPRGKRTIDKCIIVCPSSLVRNWANEIVKWLGQGVLTPLAIDGKSTKPGDLSNALVQWASARGRNIVRPVLIISYETLRRNMDKLAGIEVGLLLADEGHRLKNGESLTFTALDSLNCARRVILSGTPIQNDLSEYFSLLNFSNPGLLGSKLEFRKNFELAILRGRDAEASDAERAKGDAKLAELSGVVSKFIIRRTNDILSKYLPVKFEHVVFCRLAPMQEQVYNHFITSPEIRKLMKGVGSQPLKAIGMLKKLCNHPDLLDLPEDVEGSEEFIPDDYLNSLRGGGGRNREIQTWFSGKFAILERFLAKMRRETNDKIVLISNYTQTLDLIERMCRYRKYGALRLDGTLNINKRQKLVDKFNDPEGNEFIFLLSSKAGGCGINLIGANRLILFDPDWNPAADQQALARVWRDGQTKSCFIYRFIATGTIEEKIFQRQSMKMSLSSCVVDEAEDVDRHFTADGLKKLFEFSPEAICDTHDTYKCKRCRNGSQFIKSPAMLYGDATTWNHINHDGLVKSGDILLENEANFDDISFAFQFVSH